MRRLLERILGRCRRLLRAPPIAVLTGRDGGDPVIEFLLREATGAFLVIDREGRTMRASPALRNLLGTDIEIQPGADAADIFHPASRPAIWRDVVRLLRGQIPRIDDMPATLAAPTAEAAGASALLSAAAILDASGAIDGAFLRLVDITPQTKLTALLQQSQRIQAVGQFAGGIAHDFNNVLTAIMGAADSIATRPATAPETVDDAGQILDDADRGADLVRQLLAFSRQQPLAPVTIAINDTISALARMLRRLIGESIRLELDLAQPSRTIRADRTQLDQVLVNLAVNARDAMPGGGVLTLTTGHLTLYRERPNGAEPIPPGRYCTIEVADTGGGIPADVLPRIFDPFFTTKGGSGGTGLGLATVRSIVRQSDGHMSIDSTPGQGTRVRILFPTGNEVSNLPTAPAPPAPPIAAPPPGRLLLLAEDEDPVRLLAARGLERHGWRVLAAASGEDALALLDSTPQPITALISDMALPGIDGASLLRAIRARPDCAGVPAILVSGYADRTLRDAFDATDTAFMTKPYLPRDLAARLDTLLRDRPPPAV